MEKDSQEHFKELIAYDPGLGEPPTEAIAAALEASMRDADLRARHQDELAFDTAFRAKLADLPVPESLREDILRQHAQRQGEREAIGLRESATTRSRSWWGHVVMLGSVAAAVLVLAVIFTFFVNPFEARATPELNNMVAKIEESLLHHGGMYFSEDYNELVRHLADNAAPVPEALPAGISRESSFACRELTIEGASVTMLCFKRGEDTFHLFTFARSEMPELASIPRPIITEFERNRCATWTDEAKVYVLATRAPRQVLLSAL